MKTYNITRRISKQARAAIENTIAMHEKYKNTDLLSPSECSVSRLCNEYKFRRDNPEYTLENGDTLIEVTLGYHESENKIYYGLEIEVDGEIKDIRALKELLK